jgi:molybdate-binding protein
MPTLARGGIATRSAGLDFLPLTWEHFDLL